MVLINRLMKDLQKPAGVYQGGQVRFGSLLKSVFKTSSMLSFETPIKNEKLASEF